MELSTETQRSMELLPHAAPHVGVVIGPPRSGTTLVASMLARGRGVLSLSEPLLAWSIFGNWRRRKFLRRIAREAGLRGAEPPRRASEREFVEWLVERARVSGRSRVVLKETYRGGTPWPKWNNAGQVERLLDTSRGVPTPLVAMVRHPYAVAASTIRLCAPLLGYGGWQGFCIRLVWPVLPKPSRADEVVRIAARNWAAFADWLRGRDLTLVRYEELIARPREVLTTICSALDIPFDEAMVDAHAPGRAIGLGDKDVLQGPPRAVDGASLARGEDLTSAQRATVRAECGEAASRMGYSLDK